MARSMWKGPFTDPALLTVKKKGPIRLWSRSSTILPMHVGLTFEIHNGRTFLKKKIVPLMVGHKFGELAMTRKMRRSKKV